MILYKESALDPIKVVKNRPLVSGALGLLGAPLIYNMLVKPFVGETPVDKVIGATYGKIPFLGKHIYGFDTPESDGLEKIKDPSVRSQLLREGGSVFSPNKTMHGSEAIKHHLAARIVPTEADRNNPMFKNIRDLSTDPDTAGAFQQAVEEGRTSYVDYDQANNDRLMAGLSAKQKKYVKAQREKTLDAMVGAGRYGWNR